MYFYRELASHVSLTSWRNSLFSPPPVSLVNRFTHHPFTVLQNFFKISRKTFSFLLLSFDVKIYSNFSSSSFSRNLAIDDRPTMRKGIRTDDGSNGAHGWRDRRGYYRARGEKSA